MIGKRGFCFILLIAHAVMGCAVNAPVTVSPLFSPMEIQSSPQAGKDSFSVEDSAETPVPGFATVKGFLLSIHNDAPIPGTTFYLIPADENGEPPIVFTEEMGLKGVSGPHGEMELKNVPPGTYYIGVWVPYSYSLVFESKEVRSPKRLELRADDRVDLGKLYVLWP